MRKLSAVVTVLNTWLLIIIGTAVLFVSTIICFIIWDNLYVHILNILSPYIHEDYFILCIRRNIFRVSFYLILFYGQIVIIRNVYLRDNCNSISLFRCYKNRDLKVLLLNGIQGLKTQFKNGWLFTIFVLLIQVSLWVIYWFCLSIAFAVVNEYIGGLTGNYKIPFSGIRTTYCVGDMVFPIECKFSSILYDETVLVPFVTLVVTLMIGLILIPIILAAKKTVLHK